VKKQRKPGKIKTVILKALLCLLPLCFCLGQQVPVLAWEAGGLQQEQAGSDEMAVIREELKKVLESQDAGFLKYQDPDRLINEIAAGTGSFSFGDFLKWLGAVLFRELGANLSALARIVIIAGIFAFLKGFQLAGANSGVTETAFYGAYVAVAAMLLTVFAEVMGMASAAVGKMTELINYTSPALFALVAAGGKPLSAATLKPAFVFGMQLFANLLLKIFLPLFLLIAVLHVVDNLSEDIKVTNFISFLNSLVNWTMGICMTVFVAFLSIQGIIASAGDSVTGKTAKYAAGTFIPVVGKYLADSIDAVITSASSIKNVAGAGLMTGVMVIFAAPAVKILAISALYRLTGALIEPVADKRLSGCIRGMAETMNNVAGIAAMLAVLLIISLAVIIKSLS